MQKIIAIILFIFSFFTAGDMTKANVTVAKELTAGDTSAVFVFENKTGKAISPDVKVESVEKEVLGEWVPLNFEQAAFDAAGKSAFETRVYPTEKINLNVTFLVTIANVTVEYPLTAGNYRITVSYKTDGYSSVTEGTLTSPFTVAQAA